ncbi:MAG: hypothetical protein ACRCYE_11925 [Sarcina sp.]
MIYTQQPAILNSTKNNLMSLDALKSASSMYKVNITLQNQAGYVLLSYPDYGYGYQTLGSAYFPSNYKIINAEVNGKSMSLAQAEKLTYAQAGSQIVLTTTASPNLRYGSVDVCIMNQNGMELTPIQDIQNATPEKVLSLINSVNYPIESITYDGSSFTKEQLANTTFPSGQNGLLVVTMKTPTPIKVVASLDGSNGVISLPTYQDTVSSNGARIEIPSGLLKHFNVTGVTIDNVNYKGTLEGNTFVIDQPIKYSPVEYFINLHVAYKN